MPRNDHDDLKSRGGPRDLTALKARLARKAGGSPSMMELTSERVRNALDELDALRQFIRDTYQESISCEDARDFTLGIQESFHAKIESWGEKPMTAEEYMEAQRVADERARDLAQIELLKKKHGIT